MLCYRCSRGLDIYKIEDSFYILDQFGNKEILKFENENDLKNIIETNYNINIIVNEEYCENLIYDIESVFNQLEDYGVKIFLKSEKDLLNLPIACSTLGYGEGNIESFKYVEDTYKVFPQINLIAGYNYYDFQKLYDDYSSLVHRGIDYYCKFIIEIREMITKFKVDNEEELKIREFEASWYIVNCVISLSSALDVAARLFKFLDMIEYGNNKIYLKTISNKNIDFKYFKDNPQMSFFFNLPIFKALRNLRNDLVHNLGTIELERNQYVGRSTPCINNHELAYYYMPMRDINIDGTTIHENGRKYFTHQENDMDIFLSSVLKNFKYFTSILQKNILNELEKRINM